MQLSTSCSFALYTSRLENHGKSFSHLQYNTNAELSLTININHIAFIRCSFQDVAFKSFTILSLLIASYDAIFNTKNSIAVQFSFVYFHFHLANKTEQNKTKRNKEGKTKQRKICNENQQQTNLTNKNKNK